MLTDLPRRHARFVCIAALPPLVCPARPPPFSSLHLLLNNFLRFSPLIPLSLPALLAFLPGSLVLGTASSLLPFPSTFTLTDSLPPLPVLLFALLLSLLSSANLLISLQLHGFLHLAPSSFILFWDPRLQSLASFSLAVQSHRSRLVPSRLRAKRMVHGSTAAIWTCLHA